MRRKPPLGPSGWGSDFEAAVDSLPLESHMGRRQGWALLLLVNVSPVETPQFGEGGEIGQYPGCGSKETSLNRGWGLGLATSESSHQV